MRSLGNCSYILTSSCLLLKLDLRGLGRMDWIVQQFRMNRNSNSSRSSFDTLSVRIVTSPNWVKMIVVPPFGVRILISTPVSRIVRTFLRVSSQISLLKLSVDVLLPRQEDDPGQNQRQRLILELQPWHPLSYICSSSFPWHLPW